MKTPEEMAYDYGEKFDGVEISKNDINIAWYEGYKAAQDQLADADKVMPQWISVDKALPDRNINVLAWIKCGTSEYVFIETASGNPSECSGWKHYNKDQVTHWMPLPEPPKEEK